MPLLNQVEIRVYVSKLLKDRVIDHMAVMQRYRSIVHFGQEAIEEKLKREAVEADKIKLKIARKGGVYIKQSVRASRESIKEKAAEETQ